MTTLDQTNKTLLQDMSKLGIGIIPPIQPPVHL